MAISEGNDKTPQQGLHSPAFEVFRAAAKACRPEALEASNMLFQAFERDCGNEECGDKVEQKEPQRGGKQADNERANPESERDRANRQSFCERIQSLPLF